MTIKTVKIHPAIGIARLGNSSEFFIGPELVGDRAPPPNGYRDFQCRLKRQAARFRLFGYDENGSLVQEITASDATISWTAHLANTKAAGEKFHRADQPSSGLRNAAVGDRTTLRIDPGPQTVTGPNQTAGFNTGMFLGVQVPLGEMRTDQDSRLLILGGSGNSASPTNSPLTYWAENDGWHDDVSDGPVTASVTLNGTSTSIAAVGAWVICAPPKFAPSIQDIITLYDVLYQVAVDKGWLVAPATPSFNNDIFPLLDRASKVKWLSSMAASASAHDTFPSVIPPPGTASTRASIAGRHRDPSTPATQPDPVRNMPYVWADNFVVNAALTKVQYHNMQQWAAGTFVNDWTGGPPPPQSQITPDGLDQAALENCVGAAFYPGIETSWKTRDIYPYIEPFRLDWTQLKPGDLTQQMAVPWQTDFLDCSDGDAPYLWWPMHRPNQVWPEDGSPQTDWTRVLVNSWQDMIDNGFRLGIVVQRGDQFLETEREVVCKACTFILNRNPIGEDEVDARRAQPRNTPGGLPIQDAFRVVVDGFRAAELGLSGPGSTLNVPSPLPAGQMPIVCTGNASDTGDYGTEVQRFTFFYSIDFDSTDTAFHFTTDTEDLTLNVTAGTVSASALLTLIKQPDPFLLHGDPAWLSIDLRVFVVRPNETWFGVTMGSDAPGFIQQVMANLTSGNGTFGGQSFNDLSPEEDKSKLYLRPTDNNNVPVFNFALAKVHYIGLIGASKVRMFFRLRQTEVTYASFDYPPGEQYRRATSNPDGEPIALAGIVGNEYVTVPCFAAERIDSTLSGMDQQTDGANIQNFTAIGGPEVDCFYGCWIDINQPDNRLPVEVPPKQDGPFDINDLNPNFRPVPLKQALARNLHLCLIAEIAFDPTPIPLGKDPSNWDKLAQRNLAWSDVNTAQALTTFELRPTPIGLPARLTPDELMIDWGDTPHGSSAQIYLPAVNASDILTMAARMYASQRLTRVDDHTLACRTGGVSYVPVPRGGNINYAGLLSLDLPASLEKGRVFNIVVRQVTNAFGKRTPPPPPPPAIASHREAAVVVAPAEIEWRRVLGAFQLTIPVKTKEVLLLTEERDLSVLRWIAKAIPPHNRWYPVFGRYLQQIAGRVKAFGGDPTVILPSPTGDGIPKHRPPPHEEPEERRAFTGKVAGLIFDRFGDFEGFLLDTEDGQRKFFSREKEIEELTECAWRERLRITVWAECDEPHRPLSIIVLQPPVPFGH